MSARLVALCIVIAASGCAGQDGGSKSDFVAEADAACGSANLQLKGLGALQPEMFDASEQRHSLERWFSRFVQTLGDNLAALRDLDPPRDEEAAIDAALFQPRERILSHASETLALVRANGTPVSSSRGDDLRAAIEDARRAAAGYGFDDCAAIGG